MPSSDAKKALLVQFAIVAKAMSHAHRLELIDLLAQSERSVDELARLTGLSVANASQHLQHLHRAGLVARRRAGQHVLYGLADAAVVALLAALRVVAKNNLAEVDRLLAAYFRSKDSFEPVSSEDLIQRAREGLVTVLDVRPAEEFAAGHLPSALNIPLDELRLRLSELPRDQEVVAYCRGPYCILAFDAVAELRASGFVARRLEHGLPEWKLAGLPVEFGGLPAGQSDGPRPTAKTHGGRR